MRPLLPLLGYLKPYRRRALLGAGCIALGSGLGTVHPLIVRGAIDSLRGSGSWNAIWIWALAVVGLSLIGGTFRFFQRQLIAGTSHRVEQDMRDDLYRQLVHQPPAFFDFLPTGDIMSRFSNDLNAVRMVMGPAIMFGVNTVVTLVVAVSLMIWIDPWLTLWALLPLPAVSPLVKWLGQMIHDRSRAAQEALADVSTSVQENLAGVRVVRAYAMEENQCESFREYSRANVEANMQLVRIQAFLGPLLGFLLGGSFLIVFWVGGTRVATGTLTLGDFVAFTLYLAMISWPLIAIGWIVNLFQRGSSAMKRLGRILFAESVINDQRAVVGARVTDGSISFHDVSFQYGTGLANVLDGLTLVIPAGSTIGITGPTGSGKSTIVNLLTRLYAPGSGTIEVDGRPIEEYPLSSLREAIGYAPQEPLLFSDTLRGNLEFGGNGEGPMTLTNAVAIAGLDRDIDNFPDGFDTVVGERGITLSGGQKQRAALARALFVDPRILILDDAFSSVDTETEERILSRLREFMRERTTILISHRVSTLRAADQIVVLDHGRIIESGTHDELIALDAAYATLYRRQRLEREIESV